MTHDDSWSRIDAAAHHTKGDEATGDGERDYAEHLRGRKLSLAERLVVAGALVLLGFAGLTAHLGSWEPPSAATAATAPAAVSESFDGSDYCREYSPYPDRNC
jgi:hypothetical protein